MKLFSHPYRYLFIALLGAYSYANTVFIEAFKYYGVGGDWKYILAGFTFICFLEWEGCRIVENLVNNRLAVKTNIHPALWLFLLSLPIALAASFITYYSVGVKLLHNTASSHSILLRLTVLFSLRVNLFLQCLNAILYFLKSYKQKELEAEELRRVSVQAQLNAIQNQVNPHFLFNNLNVLSTLVLQKHNEANSFIEAFSSVYRYLLKNRNNEMVKLAEEVEFIQPYIYLLTTRFGNALHFELSIPDNCTDKYIVPAALQLLIENAIKHNIVSATQPLTIKLMVKGDYLEISNNLQEKLEVVPSTGLGLQNIRDRYWLLVKKGIDVKKSETEFIVSIPLLSGIENSYKNPVANNSKYESIDH